MRLHYALAAAVLTIGLVAAAPAAQAAPASPATPSAAAGYCRYSDATISQPEVVVGIKKLVEVDVTVTATDCGTFDTWPRIEFADGVWDYLWTADEDETKLHSEIQIDPTQLSNNDAGVPYLGEITGDDGRAVPFGDVTLTLKRAARLDVGELPSKVKKNKKFHFGAFLDRANWEGSYYTSYEGKKVRLQSSPNGDDAWKTIKTVKSMRGQNGGFLPATAKLKKPTCFRWVYEGSDTTSVVTEDAGCVKIKK